MIARDRELLSKVRAARIDLKVDGDRLLYRAPIGAITPDLKAALAELKPTLVYEFNERAAILEYDAGLPRGEAETKAAEWVLLADPAVVTNGNRGVN